MVVGFRVCPHRCILAAREPQTVLPGLADTVYAAALVKLRQSSSAVLDLAALPIAPPPLPPPPPLADDSGDDVVFLSFS